MSGGNGGKDDSSMSLALFKNKAVMEHLLQSGYSMSSSIGICKKDEG